MWAGDCLWLSLQTWSFTNAILNRCAPSFHQFGSFQAISWKTECRAETPSSSQPTSPCVRHLLLKKLHIPSLHAAHQGLSMFSFSYLSVHGIQFGAAARRAPLLPLGLVDIDVGHMLLWPPASGPIFYLFTPQLWPHWFQIGPLLWRLISDANSDRRWSAAAESLSGPAKCVLCLINDRSASPEKLDQSRTARISLPTFRS